MWRTGADVEDRRGCGGLRGEGLGQGLLSSLLPAMQGGAHSQTQPSFARP